MAALAMSTQSPEPEQAPDEVSQEDKAPLSFAEQALQSLSYTQLEQEAEQNPDASLEPATGKKPRTPRLKWSLSGRVPGLYPASYRIRTGPCNRRATKPDSAPGFVLG